MKHSMDYLSLIQSIPAHRTALIEDGRFYTYGTLVMEACRIRSLSPEPAGRMHPLPSCICGNHGYMPHPPSPPAPGYNHFLFQPNACVLIPASVCGFSALPSASAPFSAHTASAFPGLTASAFYVFPCFNCIRFSTPPKPFSYPAPSSASRQSKPHPPLPLPAPLYPAPS